MLLALTMLLGHGGSTNCGLAAVRDGSVVASRNFKLLSHVVGNVLAPAGRFVKLLDIKL